MRYPARRALWLAAVLFVCSRPVDAQDSPFVRGEVNQDGAIDIGDPIAILFHLLGTADAPCEKAADVNDSGAVDVGDVVYELEFLFREGPPPRAPFSICAADPTADALGCARSGCADSPASRVFISEVMASNSAGLTDADGDHSDWIELSLAASSPFAVDLGGWYLTDDPGLLTRWRLPAGVTLVPGGLLLVFASGKDRANAGEELHASFRIDREGDYLALVAPDGITVVDSFSPALPEQLLDISYGPVGSTTTLVAAGHATRYRVPTPEDASLGSDWTSPDHDASNWSEGATGLGFSGAVTAGFRVTVIESSIEVTDISVAEAVASDPGLQSRVYSDSAMVIDYWSGGESGNYPDDAPFPGIGLAETEDFVVVVTGRIVVPAAGRWSFGVNSDDGFRLVLSDGVNAYTMEHPDSRAPSDTVRVFDILEAGEHDLSLLYFQRNGGAELELFAAQGVFLGGFNPTSFRLVGDSAGGGIGFQSYADLIRTDVASEMLGVSASLWQRSEFHVNDVRNIGDLTLRMHYDDGFVAYLNGAEVARRNAPATPSWESSALEQRFVSDALIAEVINLTGHASRLVDGTNVLAVHGLNSDASDDGFLILPELVAGDRLPRLQYMTTPTPGARNEPGADGFVRDVEFSVERGLYEAPFFVELRSATPEVEIRYTTNGTEPGATTGTLYTGPLSIDRTSTIRAAAFRSSYLDSAVTTKTYLFIADVIRQSPNGQAPGPGWPSGSVNGQVLDYGMDPDIVNSPRWSGQIVGALRAIPAISLVTDLRNLFDPVTGIYVNAGNDGRAWERRTSVELIEPDGGVGFGVDAGLRIRGAASRSDRNPKHSFRLVFRSEYGAGKLNYALFGGEGVDEFDKVDLRTSQNYSWASDGSEKNTFIREVFSRDVQRDMGQPYTRSRYYHLYLNGQYWGLYQTQERADADFAASYLGGNDGDYDVVKNDSSGSRALQATDGTMTAYRQLYDAAVAGFASDAAYRRMQGLLPDGSPDENGTVLLDPDNLIDYMVCTYYTGDPDAPVSAWAHFSNNVFAIFNHDEPEGFTWYRHDAEHSLGANGGLNEGRLLTDFVDRSIGQEWRHFNPAWLHLRLTSHAEYALRFADRVNEHFFGGGLLSSERNIARWQARAAEIEQAVIAASARWGDARRATPRTKDDWQAESDWMTNVFFPQRTEIVLSQMRSVGMFPAAALVAFDRHGGEVPSGFELRMTQSNGTPGVVYYTTDGSDPREWGGAVSSGASIFDDGDPGAAVNVDATVTVSARVLAGGVWGAMTRARFTVGLEGLVINEVMAANVTTIEDPIENGEYPDWIEVYNGTASRIQLGGMYLTDDLARLTHWRIEAGVSIGAGEHLLFFADDDGSTHPLHTNFQLSRSGETIALVDADGTTIIDSVRFDGQTDDVSFGRYPDGGATWGFHQEASPGAANSVHSSAP